ncbi:integration host factor subunit beta [Methylobacterium nigriterrae]|uniref:integration host factor subunit beta n=1 Tax=Methylobacterium nigriterrae TaxID=3127512 RepID=UPI003013B720
MIRSDLTRRLAEQNPQLYERDCEAIVKAILGRIVNALEAGDRVEIRGFGAFSVKTLGSREGRNPRTGEKVDVAEKKAVHFKSGKEMRQLLNPEGEAPEAKAARFLKVI